MQLYNNNCLEILDQMPIESIDLFITDPPYKIVQGGCTNNAVRLKGSNKLSNGKVFRYNDIAFSEWIPKVYRILKQNTHCYIMCNDRNMRELLNECDKAGFQLLNILVWGKSKHSPNRYYLKNCEFIVMLRKGRAKNINNMGSKQLMLIDNVQDKLHPSQKPIELMKILVENSSNIGDVVLDSFMGVGTVGLACKKLIESLSALN